MEWHIMAQGKDLFIFHLTFYIFHVELVVISAALFFCFIFDNCQKCQSNDDELEVTLNEFADRIFCIFNFVFCEII